MTVRADFNGGALSSDFGPILLRGIDQHIGLTGALADAFKDMRHVSYIDHELRDLLAQRIYQMACAYAEFTPTAATRASTPATIPVSRPTTAASSRSPTPSGSKTMP